MQQCTVASLPTCATQIYETQLKELSNQTQSLSADVGAKEGLLQEARDLINSRVCDGRHGNAPLYVRDLRLLAVYFAADTRP